MKKLLCKVFGSVLLVSLLACGIAACTETEGDKYTVTYAPGNTAVTGTTPESETHAEGEKFQLAESTYSYENHTFTGWSDGTKTYAAKAEYTMPKKNVTFTAQWQENVPDGIPGLWTITDSEGPGVTMTMEIGIQAAGTLAGYDYDLVMVARDDSSSSHCFTILLQVDEEDGAYTLKSIQGNALPAEDAILSYAEGTLTFKYGDMDTLQLTEHAALPATPEFVGVYHHETSRLEIKTGGMATLDGDGYTVIYLGKWAVLTCADDDYYIVEKTTGGVNVLGGDSCTMYENGDILAEDKWTVSFSVEGAPLTATIEVAKGEPIGDEWAFSDVDDEALENDVWTQEMYWYTDETTHDATTLVDYTYVPTADITLYGEKVAIRPEVVFNAGSGEGGSIGKANNKVRACLTETSDTFSLTLPQPSALGFTASLGCYAFKGWGVNEGGGHGVGSMTIKAPGETITELEGGETYEYAAVWELEIEGQYANGNDTILITVPADVEGTHVANALIWTAGDTQSARLVAVNYADGTYTTEYSGLLSFTYDTDHIVIGSANATKNPIGLAPSDVEGTWMAAEHETVIIEEGSLSMGAKTGAIMWLGGYGYVGFASGDEDLEYWFLHYLDESIGIYGGEPATYAVYTQPSADQVWEVTFTDNKGGSGKTLSVVKGETIPAGSWPEDPVVTGWKFLGWTKDGNDGEKYTKSNPYSEAIIDATTFNAQWERQWHITFTDDKNIGSTSFYVDQNATIGDQWPNDPTAPEGFKFLGWTKNGGDDTKYTKASPYAGTITADTTFTAVWEERPQVTFTDEKGNGSTSFYVDKNTTLTDQWPEDPTATDGKLTFKGWKLSTDVSGERLYTHDGEKYETPITANIEFVAVWEKAHTITFTTDGDYDGDSWDVQTQTKKSGEAITLPEDGPTWTDHALVGWKYDGTTYSADGSGDTTAISELTLTDEMDDIEFVAVFKEDFTITLMNDGSEYKKQTGLTSTSNGKLSDLVEGYEDPTSTKGTFRYWKGTNDNSTYTADSQFSSLSGSITLEAVYDLNSVNYTETPYTGTGWFQPEWLSMSIGYGQTVTYAGSTQFTHAWDSVVAVLAPNDGDSVNIAFSVYEANNILVNDNAKGNSAVNVDTMLAYTSNSTIDDVASSRETFQASFVGVSLSDFQIVVDFSDSTKIVVTTTFSASDKHYQNVMTYTAYDKHQKLADKYWLGIAGDEAGVQFTGTVTRSGNAQSVPAVEADHQWEENVCSICGARKLTITESDTTYNATAERNYAFYNADTNAIGGQGGDASSEVQVAAGDFVAVISWSNTRDAGKYFNCGFVEFFNAANQYFDYNVVDGNIWGDLTNDKIETNETTQGTKPQQPAEEVEGDEEVIGDYEVTVYRIGSKFTVLISLHSQNESVWEHKIVLHDFTTEALTFRLQLGNTWWLDNLSFCYSNTLTPQE